MQGVTEFRRERRDGDDIIVQDSTRQRDDGDNDTGDADHDRNNENSDTGPTKWPNSDTGDTSAARRSVNKMAVGVDKGVEGTTARVLRRQQLRRDPSTERRPPRRKRRRPSEVAREDDEGAGADGYNQL